MLIIISISYIVTYHLYILYYIYIWVYKDFPRGTSSKEPTCQWRRRKRLRFDPWVGRSPGGGHGNPLLYSCLENLMDRGAWRATVHGVAKSQTRLKWLSTRAWVYNPIERQAFEDTLTKEKLPSGSLNSGMIRTQNIHSWNAHLYQRGEWDGWVGRAWDLISDPPSPRYLQQAPPTHDLGQVTLS